MFDWASSISRRCFLWAAGGVIAKLWPTPGSALASAAQPLSPEQILVNIEEVYARCSSYSDHGCVTTRFLKPTGEVDWGSQEPFSTAFVRPDRFRFESKSHFPRRTKWHRYLVWSEKDDVRSWWDIRPGVEYPESLALALAGATGVSGGSAHTIPSLLLPPRVSPSRRTEGVELRRLEDAKFKGADCFRIQRRYLLSLEEKELLRKEMIALVGHAPEDSEEAPELLWIEKPTFLLRRIESTRRTSRYHTESETIYEPQMGARISEEQLRFDAPEGSGA